MPRDYTVPPAPSQYARDLRADRLRAAWSEVHIEVVETERFDRGYRVSAVVHLDGLTPADVVVRLAPAAQAAAQDWPPEWRMWSTTPYDNGRFLFERDIPLEDDATHEWVVAVHPAGPPVGRPVVYPLQIGAPAPDA